MALHTLVTTVAAADAAENVPSVKRLVVAAMDVPVATVATSAAAPTITTQETAVPATVMETIIRSPATCIRQAVATSGRRFRFRPTWIPGYRRPWKLRLPLP